MENPLTADAQQTDRNVRLGRDSRTAARRREDERTIQAALTILQEIIPRLFRAQPDASQFAEFWPKADKAIEQHLGNPTAYRRVYSWIRKQLEAGNQAGIWVIDIPPPIVTLRQRRSTRTLRRHQHARLVALAEDSWKTRLTTANSVSPSGQLARLLLSSIMYGGLNRALLWPALAEALNQPKPLCGNSSLCWIPLHIPPGQGWASNRKQPDDSADSEKPVCEVHYFPDSITLGLLRQYLSSKDGKKPQAPGNLSACLELINKELKASFTQRQLEWGGVTIAESQPGVELPQVLVEYATGRQPSSSLPACYWNRLLRPSIGPCGEYLLADFAVFSGPVSQLSRTPTKKQRRPHILSKLTRIFKVDPAKPRTKRQLITELAALADECGKVSEQVLLGWLIHHLNERGNAESTARRYMNTVAAEWLNATEPHDLLSFDQEDFQSLYSHILDTQRSQKERAYRAGRLEDLHQFGVQTMDFPPLHEPLQEGSGTAPHVSAAIVDEPLFSGLLLQCDQFKDITPLHRTMLKCFLIMAFRTALRPGEIAKLRLRDIEPSPDAWLFVRDNKHGSNKTAAALRKVPLFPLLTEPESQLMRDFIGSRRLNSQSSAELLFHQPDNPREPLDTRTLSIVVKKILADLSGGLYYRLYHLRHSALTRLQLLIHHDQVSLPAEVDTLMPYPPMHRQNLLEKICGQGRLRDRYQAIAVLAGHSSPGITLSTYMHFSDLLLALHLKKNRRSLSSTEAFALLGLRRHRISHMHRNNSLVTPAALTGYLHKRLTRFIQAPQPIRSNDKLRSIQTAKMRMDQTAYIKALGVLGKIQSGQDPAETAVYYQLSTAQIEHWHQAALALRELATDKNASRLFPKSRRHQLLPPEPVDVSEKRDLAAAHHHCRKLFAKSHSRPELLWLIEYTLTHINSAHSGISFHSAQDFRRYMKTVTQVFEWPRWRLHIGVMDTEVLSQWRCGALLMEYRLMKQKARFAHGKGILKLRHPEEKGRTEAGKKGYSSHTLITLFHRLAIVLFAPDEIRAWQG